MHPNKPKYTPKYITIGGQKFTYFHFATFTLTFVCYSLFHATRKTFSNVKTSVSETWTGTCDAKNHTCVSLKPDDVWNSHSFFTDKSDAKFFLGVLDASFLGAYSLGLFISGILGDRFDLRLVLTLGMTLSAVAMFLFGVVSEWLQVYSEFWYLSFWILSGFAQSTGWPAVVAVMGNWFGQNGRGLIFGIWAANASVGNIIGALMVSAFLGYGYQYAFIFTSTVLFAGGVVVFFGLVPHPKDIGLPDPDAVEPVAADETTDEIMADSNQRVTEPLLNNHEPHKPIGFIQALLLPGVILYSLCYACLKMVNYSFLFWLPYYLSNKFNWHEEIADQISIWYDIGGIFGGIIGGLISDQIKKRSVVIFTMLTIALPSLYIFSESSDSQAMNAFLMTIVGFFIGGAANIISAAITADLGKQGPIQGNAEGLATVTGIVDGTGSVGAAVGQLLVPAIQNAFNWFYVFYFFIVLCVLTNVCILPLFVREIRELILQFRSRARAGYRAVNSAESD